MLGVKLPFKINNCEMAAYKLSEIMIKRGFSADVKFKDGIYSTIVHKKRLVNNIIGTPPVVVASFFALDDGTGIEVREGMMDVCLENVIKEIALYALIIPGIIKRIDAVKTEKKLMRKALIVAKSLVVNDKN